MSDRRLKITSVNGEKRWINLHRVAQAAGVHHTA